MVKDRGGLACCSHGVTKSRTRLSDSTTASAPALRAFAQAAPAPEGAASPPSHQKSYVILHFSGSTAPSRRLRASQAGSVSALPETSREPALRMDASVDLTTLGRYTLPKVGGASSGPGPAQRRLFCTEHVRGGGGVAGRWRGVRNDCTPPSRAGRTDPG